MSKQKSTGAIRCAAEGCEYRLTSDEQNLYLEKIGASGAEKENTPLGSSRVVKAEVESITCRRVSGKYVLWIDGAGRSSRFEIKGRVDDAQLIRLFDGVSMNLHLHAQSATLTDRYELELFCASLMITLVRFLCEIVPEISAWGHYVELAWIAVPFFWMVPCAKRMLKGNLKDQFPMGGGMCGSFYAGIMLWVFAVRGIESPTALMIPAVLAALAIGALYGVLRRKMDAKALIAVVMVALLVYTPGACACFNRILPSQREEQVQAEVVELNDSPSGFAVTVNENGAQKAYALTKAQYERIAQGDRVSVCHVVGALGIPYVQIL